PNRPYGRITSQTVEERVPGKQGLKLETPASKRKIKNVEERVPGKQGLKQFTCGGEGPRGRESKSEFQENKDALVSLATQMSIKQVAGIAHSFFENA
ncbi:MAG: hypothetical protein N3G75_07940, partial [Methanothrix sp.]